MVARQGTLTWIQRTPDNLEQQGDWKKLKIPSGLETWKPIYNLHQYHKSALIWSTHGDSAKGPQKLSAF